MARKALPAIVEEVTSAFDSANHAWGRYFLYVYRPYRGPATLPDATPVREALQEAAISIPVSDDPEELKLLAIALHDALTAVRALLAALPADLATGDIVVVPEALEEALSLLDQERRAAN